MIQQHRESPSHGARLLRSSAAWTKSAECRTLVFLLQIAVAYMGIGERLDGSISLIVLLCSKSPLADGIGGHAGAVARSSRSSVCVLFPTVLEQQSLARLQQSLHSTFGKFVFERGHHVNHGGWCHSLCGGPGGQRAKGYWNQTFRCLSLALNLREDRSKTRTKLVDHGTTRSDRASAWAPKRSRRSRRSKALPATRGSLKS